MKINNISYGQSFLSSKNQRKDTFLDRFHTKIQNSADMTDTLVVPRTIFKGYLGIMTGTTLVTLAGLVNKVKHPKMFNGTMAAGLLSSFYGTWAFVRPYIIKDAVEFKTS